MSIKDTLGGVSHLDRTLFTLILVSDDLCHSEFFPLNGIIIILDCVC